ncbi:DUF637 domain-containing protein, partial [Pseudomonas chlororaphis]
KQIDQKSVSQTIDAMVQADPQLAWLKEAEKRGDVDWRKVQEVHESFKYSHSGLGQGAMLAIIIIVTVLTAGAASAAVGTAAGATAGSGSAMAAAGTSAMVQAGTATAVSAAGWGNVAATAMITSAASGAAISTINNRGNLGAVVKDVTSSDSLKSYAAAGVSGGLAGANVGARLAVNSALKTVVNGGKFKDNLGQAAVGLAADMLTGAIYEKVGDSLVGSGLPTKVAVHAIVGGLIGEAAGGDFATSALAAGANKALIQMVGDKIFPGVAHEQVLAMTSQLLGMTVAAAAGGSDKDQQVAGWVAQQGTVYNYLEHDQKEQLAKQLNEACKGKVQCIHDTLDQWKPLADKQNAFTPAEQAQYDQAQGILTEKLLGNCQSDFCKTYTLIEMKQAGLNCGDISCLRESAGATQKAQYLNQGQWGKLLLDAVGDGGAIAGALAPVLTGGSKVASGAGAVVDDVAAGGAKGIGAAGQGAKGAEEIGKLLDDARHQLEQYIGTFSKYKPPTVIGAVDPLTGKIVTTSSGAIPSEIAPELKAYAESLGGLGVKTACGNTLGRCAEFRAANELLLNNPGLKLSDIKFTSAIRPRTGEIVPRCENCTNMFGAE